MEGEPELKIGTKDKSMVKIPITSTGGEKYMGKQRGGRKTNTKIILDQKM